MNVRDIFNEIEQEIAGVTEIVDPPQLVTEGTEEPLGIGSDEVQRVYTLGVKYASREISQAFTAQIMNPPPEAWKEIALTQFKAAVYKELLWRLMRGGIPSEHQENLGLRKGFIIVDPGPPPASEQDDFSEYEAVMDSPKPRLVN
jgi:hypothetical protein